jgi:hypothetical protein
MKFLCPIILTFLFITSFGQNKYFDVIFISVNVKTVKLTDAPKKILQKMDKIELPHCSSIELSPDSLEFQILTLKLFNMIQGLSKNDRLIVTQYSGDYNFSEGGDNIRVQVLHQDSILSINRSFQKTIPVIKISHDWHAIVFDYGKNKMNKRSQQLIVSYKINDEHNNSIRVKESYSNMVKYHLLFQGYKEIECE